MKISNNFLSDSVTKQHELFKASLEKQNGVESNTINKEINFWDSIMGLNQQQKQAEFSATQVLNGNSDYAHQMMIDAEIANYHTSLATTIRDKSIQTINQLMNMQY